jgi:O-antigen/teichoic acid export membrane protein
VFAALPILSALSTLLIIPSITNVLGSAGWSSLAVGQSVGMFAALIVNFGWSVDGPGRVAGRSREERSRIFRLSLTSRFITCIIALPVAGLIAYFAAPAFRTSSALIAVATALAGALPSWYFIGIGSPFSLAIFDTIPRFLAAFASVFVLVVLPSEYVYPIILLTMMSTSIVVSAVRISGRTLIVPSRADWVLLRRNSVLVFSGLWYCFEHLYKFVRRYCCSRLAFVSRCICGSKSI